ncbi:hypothetical protein F5Y05DRAFT_381706 [Hypoxylon sp. FL0543]|nr:hypothetical protein F5Y05DRAFT_381706 [Hypoxylon sp. FL0543]
MRPRKIKSRSQRLHKLPDFEYFTKLSSELQLMIVEFYWDSRPGIRHFFSTDDEDCRLYKAYDIITKRLINTLTMGQNKPLTFLPPGSRCGSPVAFTFWRKQSLCLTDPKAGGKRQGPLYMSTWSMIHLALTVYFSRKYIGQRKERFRFLVM